MIKPAVSVLIPILNMRRYLAETAESVFAQSFQDWEMLFMDDGSTDGSVELAEQLVCRDPNRVRVLAGSTGESLGASAARNRGLRAARGEWIAFLDADDIWLPDKLARQTEILQRNPDAAMTFARVRYFYDDPTVAPEWDQTFGALREGVYNPPFLAQAFLRDANVYPCPSATLIRTQALREVGGFEERFRKVRTDLAVWVKLSARFLVYADPSLLVRYRQHAESSVARLFRDENLYNANELMFAEWLSEQVETLSPDQRRPLEEITAARLFRSHLMLLKERGAWQWRWQMIKRLWKYPVYRRGGRILQAVLPTKWRPRESS